MAIETILLFLAFSIALYVAGDYLFDAYVRARQRSFLPNEERGEQVLEMLKSSDRRRMVNLIAAVFGALIAMNFRLGPAVTLVGAAVGWLLPSWYLARQERKRLAKLGEQLVPTLTLIANGMRAGKTLPQALEEVSGALERPMAQEIAIISRQLRVGLKPEEAIREFAVRVPLSDVKLAVRAMTTSLRTGSNLPQAIKKIAETVGSRIRVEGRIKVLTTQGNMQGIIVGLAPFVLLAAFYVMSPEYVRVLFDTRIGNVLLAGMVVLQTLAVATIRRITSVKV